MTESPVFIVGCPRSGTSLLRDLLRSHPNLAFPNESHFIPGLYKAYGDPRTEREARALAARILRLQWVPSWELPLDPAALARHRSYAGLVSEIYEAVAAREGKPRWGDKTPQYVTELPTLLEVFPGARVIHIYRDGRDVALSWRGAGFGPQNAFSAATTWRELVVTGRRDGEALPPGSYAELSYERLLTDPEETMRRVCEFIGEPFSMDVLRPSPPSGPEIRASGLASWRTAMSRRERSVFESVAGRLLSSLDYETEAVARRVSRPERATWMLHDWSRRAARRARPSDQNWQLKTLLMMRGAGLRRRVRATLRGRAA